jgi:SAM-dependent methyltransferase
MFSSYSELRQHNNDAEIDNYKEFYKHFSNKCEFGGNFTHYDHLVKSRFNSNLQVIYNAILRKQPSNILDVGCGSGVNLPLSKIFQLDYHGVDYAEKSIAAAKVNYPNATFHVADAFNMDLMDKSFDMVILSSVLILYRNPDDRTNLINECLRIMKDDGVLILVVWNDAPFVRWSIKLSRLLGSIFGEKLPRDFMAIHLTNRELRHQIAMTNGKVSECINTSANFGVLQSVQYLNFSKYRRKYGATESEWKNHSQNVLVDLVDQAGRLRFLTKIYYYIAKHFPDMFNFYSVCVVSKK